MAAVLGSVVATSIVAVPTAPAPAMQGSQDSQLTAAEKKAGWTLLFNGTSLDGWKGYKADASGTF